MVKSPKVEERVDPRLALVLIDTDGRHRFLVQRTDAGEWKYVVGTGKSGDTDPVTRIEDVVQRVIFGGKTVTARTVGRNGPRRYSGVTVPGKSIVDYWLAPELRHLVANAQTLPLAELPHESTRGDAKPQDGRPWSDEELRATVDAYLAMLAQERTGANVVQAEVHRDLAKSLGRAAKAIELHMHNISSVLALLGRQPLRGLPPASHVGTDLAAKLETFIAEAEGRKVAPVAAFEIAAREMLRRAISEKPEGVAKPKTTTTPVASFVRDPAVKAWVLQRAQGECESCKQPAPFTSQDGFPYLEVHHLRTLAERGSDTVTNAAAICPNCHRRMHYGKDAAEIRERLYATVSELTPE